MLRKYASFRDIQSYDRFQIWSVSLDLLRKAPLVGWGMGTYGDAYTFNQPEGDLIFNDRAHSTPYEALDELGIDEFDVFGMHTGSCEAVEHAVARPGRVRRAGVGRNIALAAELMEPARMFAWIAFVICTAVTLNMLVTSFENDLVLVTTSAANPAMNGHPALWTGVSCFWTETRMKRLPRHTKIRQFVSRSAHVDS